MDIFELKIWQDITTLSKFFFSFIMGAKNINKTGIAFICDHFPNIFIACINHVMTWELLLNFTPTLYFEQKKISG